jgi:hypothetical protein
MRRTGMDKDAAIILTQSKSMAVGLIITWFFGGLGVFYVSMIGGLVLGGLEVVGWIIAFMTLGIGAILLIPVHFVALIWTYLGVKKHNAKLISGLNGSTPSMSTAAEAVPSE